MEVEAWCLTLAASALSYTRSTTSGWSVSSTIDNTAVDTRASGVGANLALVGDAVVISYLDWNGGAGEIRLARIAESLSEPTITRLIEGVVIPDRPGTHPIALRADVLGRLHLLVADAGAAGVILQYWRQTPVGGELRWIHSTIATFPGASTEAIPVDMVLGPDCQPPIVYRDPSRADIMHATLDPE